MTFHSDPSNELVKMLYERLGMSTDLLPRELKEYISQGFVINPHVYSVINKIIRPSSAVPFYIYEIKPDKKKEFGRYKAAMKAGDYDNAEIYGKKALELVETIPELTRLLEQPNEHQSFQEWIEQAMGFHLLTGEQFIYGLSPAGFPKEQFTKLYNMPPQLTVLELGDLKTPVKGYYIDYFGLNKSEIIDPYKICHVKYMNPDYSKVGNELRGLSPMSTLCTVVKKNNDNYIAQLRMIQNGGPSGILSSGSERGSTPEDAKKLKQQWREKYQGAGNKNDIMITSAQLEWIAMGMNSVDMQLLDADKADLESIARVYSVPLPLMLNDASSYNNIKEAKKQCWNDARLPLLDQQKNALNRWLLPAYKKRYNKDLFIDYDLMSIHDLKEDDKNVVEILEMEIRSGIRTPNEARLLRNMDPSTDPNADLLYIGNLRPLDQAMQQFNQQNNGK